jgi:hypothetical protein
MEKASDRSYPRISRKTDHDWARNRLSNIQLDNSLLAP